MVLLGGERGVTQIVLLWFKKKIKGERAVNLHAIRRRGYHAAEEEYTIHRYAVVCR